MDSEDLVAPEVAAAVAVTAVVASPQVRSLLRRGAVYGLAGVLLAGDGLVALSKGVGRGAQSVAGGVAAGMAQGRQRQTQAKRVPVEIGEGGQADNGYQAIEAPAMSEE
jgi:hypothetical protein